MTDDLIGRAEAQTAIQFAAKRYTVAHEAHGEGQVVWSDNLINVTDAMNVLRDLPSVQPEQRWIPVSERLPEDFKKVLVFWWEHSEPMIDTAFWQKDAKRFDGQHWVRIEDKITHWMPLPEPARLEND